MNHNVVKSNNFKGSRLRDARTERGMSMAVLAGKLGLNGSYGKTISFIESNRIKPFLEIERKLEVLFNKPENFFSNNENV